MITLDSLLALPGAALAGPAAARGFADIAYDSRLAQPGELFVALRTERGDGHAYIADALASGCTGVLCEHVPPLPDLPATIVSVPDTAAALRAWAAARLRAVAPRVVAIAGSAGKTSVRRAAAALLAPHVAAFQSRRSFNTPIGLPIALARLSPEHRVALLELAADRFGELETLVALAAPHAAVLTNVGPAGLHFFGGPGAFAAELGALVRALPPDGLLALNADDPLLAGLAHAAPCPVLTFGLNPGAGLRAAGLALETSPGAPPRMRFTLHYPGGHTTVTTALPGRHGVLNTLAALAAALAAGITLDQAIAGLPQVVPAPGRLNPLCGLRGALLLDDTYSASELSLHTAIATLLALPGRRCAVLGELDANETLTEPAFAAIAQALARLDLLVALGDTAAALAARVGTLPGAIPAIVQSPHVEHARSVLEARLAPGDVLLVKGGAPARLERLIAGLLAPGQTPAELLVRQEQVWERVRAVDPGRPAWIEVDLHAVAANTRALLDVVGPGVELMAVLKADAYGHGTIRVARATLAAGATWLAVATLSEAEALRRAGIAAPILILGYTPPWQVREAVRLGVTVACFDLDVARALSTAAAEVRRPAVAHVKVDTGMARLGLAPAEVPAFLEAARSMPGLVFQGLFTHLASADEPDLSFAHTQLDRFDALLAELAADGLRPPLVHAANSAALLRLPRARYNLVRPGIALYGHNPCPASGTLAVAPGETPAAERPGSVLTPALTFRARLARVAALPTGTPVSYGGEYVTPGPRRIATIPVGYADGFRRSPPWHTVLVGGRRCPIVGRICMDYAMCDVTAVPGVAVGDEVVLIGRQGGEQITAEEVAGWLGTSVYEVLAAILPRVPRIVE